jgi:hypothetical protein
VPYPFRGLAGLRQKQKLANRQKADLPESGHPFGSPVGLSSSDSGGACCLDVGKSDPEHVLACSGKGVRESPLITTWMSLAAKWHAKTRGRSAWQA